MAIDTELEPAAAPADPPPPIERHRRSIITRIAVTATEKWKATLGLLVVVVIAGISAYAVALPREGFPPINTPISVVSGTWFVDDAEQVDQQAVAPLTEAFLAVEGVEAVDTEAFPSSFGVVVEFESSIDSETGTDSLRAVEVALPEGVEIQYNPINAASFVGRFDVLVSITGPADATPQDLQAQGEALAAYLEQASSIEEAEVRDLVTDGIDPDTGADEERITRYTRVAFDGGEYQNAIAVGIVRTDDSSLDVLEFSDELESLITAAAVPLAEGYEASITADFAIGVRQQLSSLTTNLLTGLAAVALVSLILIGWRVALITAGFMALVLLGALVGLWGVGFSLNTITLFGLILTLGLIVDDAIVISESIDANKRESNTPVGVIRAAIDRVGSPSFAGTLTTVVVFSPMLFVGGILGEFIRPIPTTVIITLLLSFLFSIVFIPVIARRFLVRSKPSQNPIARLERRAARGAGRLAAYPSGNGAKGWAVGWGLAAFAIAVIVAAGSIAGTLGFSIFPAGKDATGITVDAEFDPGTTIEEAELIADELDVIVLDVLGDDFDRSQYLRGNERVLENSIALTPIGSRPTAPTFVDEIEERADAIPGVRVNVAQQENGPPLVEYPFAVQIAVDDSTVDAGQALAEDIRSDLIGRELRAGGTTVTILDSIVSTDGLIARSDGERYIEVRAQYDNDNVTSNLNATESYVAEQYPPSDLEARGLAPDALDFDFGAESDNQDDFAALGVAGLVALLLMLVVITVQFRSLAQSLLIFLAIPFSFFGVFALLSATDNPLSFLVTVGFIALIGVAVNNTILLVDAANRARRDGASAGEAIQEAVTRRFRPLIATTLTTVVGLLPLSLSDPFWESLGFTLIGGLVSSTFLVLLAFPAFYLGLEAVRTPVRNAVRRRRGKPEIA
ncbi:MAG: efflux RND transporter permease subunit [Actinomycetota bacterium]